MVLWRARDDPANIRLRGLQMNGAPTGQPRERWFGGVSAEPRWGGQGQFFSDLTHLLPGWLPSGIGGSLHSPDKRQGRRGVEGYRNAIPRRYRLRREGAWRRVAIEVMFAVVFWSGILITWKLVSSSGTCPPSHLPCVPAKPAGASRARHVNHGLEQIVEHDHAQDHPDQRWHTA